MDKPRTLTLARQKVQNIPVSSGLCQGTEGRTAGYIKLTTFNSNTTKASTPTPFAIPRPQPPTPPFSIPRPPP